MTELRVALPVLVPTPRELRSSAFESPRNGVALPYFKSSESRLRRSRKRREEPEDANKTSLERALDELQLTKESIYASLDRMNQTQAAIEHELAETALMAETLRIDQEHIAIACYQYFDYSARQIQRVFRGHLGRRVLRQLMALKAALRIQRAYRAMRARRLARLKRFRGICRRMLRGLRGVIAKQELSHKELLSRVNQNMLIDTQWRKAMGVADSENDLISALYRKKFMRRRIGTLFRQFYWIHSITKFWHSLVPENQHSEPSAAPMELLPQQTESCESQLDSIDEERVDENSKAFLSSRSLLDTAADSGSPRGRPKIKPNEYKNGRRVVDRVELRRRQRLYTERIYNENLKREAVRAVVAEKQREAARIAAVQQQEQEDQQRLLRLQRAQQLRDDMDRRGQHILREMQSKKEEELRHQQEAESRLRLARTKIATEVLSEETQHILKRRTKKTHPQEPHGSFMSI